MKLIIFFLFVICFSQPVISQVTESTVDLYASTMDFNNRENVPAIAIIKEQTDSYIKIKDFIDPVTKKPIKRSFFSLGT